MTVNTEIKRLKKFIYLLIVRLFYLFIDIEFVL